MVLLEDLKGRMLGRKKLQVPCWTQTSGKNSQLPSQHLTLSPPPPAVSWGHPSLWPLGGRHCCSHLSRAIDPLSDLQSLDTGILFRPKCWCLLGPSLHPLPRRLPATALLLPLLSHVSRLSPGWSVLGFYSFYLFPRP